MQVVPRCLATSAMGLLLALAACDTGNLTHPAVPPVSSSPPTSGILRVLVAPDTASIAVGDIVKLKATVLDQFGNRVEGQNVQWRGSQSSRIRVSSDGLVEGISTGEDTIRASLNGSSGTSVLRIRPAKVHSVTVTLHPQTLLVGQTGYALADLRAANGNSVNGNVYWTSSNRSVAAIDEAGNITAVGAGRATITGISEGKSDSETLEVAPNGNDSRETRTLSVSVSSPTFLLYVGRTVALTATVRDESGTVVSDAPLTWTSSDPSVASVDPSGTVEGLSAGTATFTASTGTASGQTTLTVATAPVKRISLSISPSSIEQGQSVNSVVTIYDDAGNVLSGRTVQFSSSDPAVSVSSTGVVTGQRAGSSTVTATCEGKSASVEVTVKSDVVLTGISVTPGSVSLLGSAIQQFTATGSYSDGSSAPLSVSWSATGGTISLEGLYLAGLVAGDFRVIAKHAGTGYADTASVTISLLSSPPPPPPSNPPTSSFATCGNEPSGFAKQVDIGFNVLPGIVATSNPLSTEGTRTWWTQNYTVNKIVTDASAPRGGGVLQTEFIEGMPGGTSPAGGWAKFEVLREDGRQFQANSGQIYICLFVKRSGHWTDNGNAGTKLFFAMTPQWTGRHYSSYNHEHKPAACVYSTTSRCFNSTTQASEGEWHKLEYLFSTVTPGQANSSVTVWIDGELRSSASDVVMFFSGDNTSFGSLLYDPTYGGGTNPVPSTQYIWIDHLYVSVK